MAVVTCHCPRSSSLGTDAQASSHVVSGEHVRALAILAPAVRLDDLRLAREILSFAFFFILLPLSSSSQLDAIGQERLATPDNSTHVLSLIFLSRVFSRFLKAPAAPHPFRTPHLWSHSPQLSLPIHRYTYPEYGTTTNSESAR